MEESVGFGSQNELRSTGRVSEMVTLAKNDNFIQRQPT